MTSEWPVIKCVMNPNGGEAMWQFKMSSKKVLNCYHEYQQLVGRTRFYHLVFVMKMMCARGCSSRGAFGVNAFFRWIYPMTHNAPSHHLIFFWSYSLYKSFSLWKQHKAFFKTEIILLLLGKKQGDSRQHKCFSLGFYPPPHSTLPIQSSNKHTAVQQGRRLVKASTHFYSGVSHLYIKRVGHIITTHPTHTLSLKNNLNPFSF